MDHAKALEILGLNATATPAEMKEAYRDLTKVWHPDRFIGEPRLHAKAEEAFKRINEAYQFLLTYVVTPSGDTSWQESAPIPSHPASPPLHPSQPWVRHHSAHREWHVRHHRPHPLLRWTATLAGFAVFGVIGYIIMQSDSSFRSTDAGPPLITPGKPLPKPPASKPRAAPASKRVEPQANEESKVPEASFGSGATNTKTSAPTRKPSKSQLAIATPTREAAGAGNRLAAGPVSESQNKDLTAGTYTQTLNAADLAPEELVSLEAACTQSSSFRGPAAYQRCLEDQLAKLRASARRPNLSKLSEVERQSAESACTTAKYVEGPEAYNRCLRGQVENWAATPQQPDLSRLSARDRNTVETACAQARYADGPAAYNRCLRDEIVLLSVDINAPDLSPLTPAERSSIHAACYQKNLDVPATSMKAYNRCLQEQVQLLNAGPSRPDLSALANPELESIESACAEAKYLQGAAAYNRCLKDQLSMLAAAPKRPDFSDLNVYEVESVEAACSTAKYLEGPAAYNRCLAKEIAVVKIRR